LQSITKEKNEEIITDSEISKQSPVKSFRYALKSSEARRQYPKRLKMLFDFLGLPGSLEEQASEFLRGARRDIQSCQDGIISFLDFHNQRVKRKELASSDDLVGCSPEVRACCAIVRCCQHKEIELSISCLAAEAHVTLLAIRNALKRKV
jgi:hypothetical protein